MARIDDESDVPANRVASSCADRKVPAGVRLSDVGALTARAVALLGALADAGDHRVEVPERVVDLELSPARVDPGPVRLGQRGLLVGREHGPEALDYYSKLRANEARDAVTSAS